MYCENCGSELSLGVRFCSSCGASVINDSQLVSETSLSKVSRSTESIIHEGLCNRIVSPIYVQNGHGTLTSDRFIYKPVGLGSILVDSKSKYEVEIPIKEIKLIEEGRQGVSKTIIIHTVNEEKYNFYFAKRKLWLDEMSKLVSMRVEKVMLENSYQGGEVEELHLKERITDQIVTAKNRVFANPAAKAIKDKELAIGELRRLRDYFILKENNYTQRNSIIYRLSNLKRPSFGKWLIGGLVISFVLTVIIEMAFSFDIGWLGMFLLWGVITIWGYRTSRDIYSVELAQLNEKSVLIETELIEHYNKASNCIIAFEYSEPEIIKKIIELMSTGRADNVKEGINIMLDDLHKEAMYLQQLEIAKNSKDAASSSATTNLLIGASILSKKK